MIYYTADWHLGHANIIKLCNRPFDNIEDMNRAIIANYNSVVTNADTVYILGDVAFKSGVEIMPILRKLKGKKHLILGNHDKGLRNNPETTEVFATVSDLYEVHDNGQKVVLSHYPMLSWNGLFGGSIHIFGHIHNSIGDPGFDVQEELNTYNAGVDVNGFLPVTLAQLRDNKRKFYEQIHSGYDPKRLPDFSM